MTSTVELQTVHDSPEGRTSRTVRATAASPASARSGPSFRCRQAKHVGPARTIFPDIGWPSESGSVKAIDILVSIGITQGEPFSDGLIGSIRELVHNFGDRNAELGAQRAADLLRDFVSVSEAFQEQLERASQNTPFQLFDQGTVAGLGRVQKRDFVPASRASEFAGRDFTVSMDYFRNLPPAVWAVIWQQLIAADRDQSLGVVDRRRFSGEA